MLLVIEGDGTNKHIYVRIIYPDGGQTYDEDFEDFERTYEDMAAARGWTIQTMHYRII